MSDWRREKKSVFVTSVNDDMGHNDIHNHCIHYTGVSFIAALGSIREGVGVMGEQDRRYNNQKGLGYFCHFYGLCRCGQEMRESDGCERMKGMYSMCI